MDYCENFNAVLVADTDDATLVTRTRCKQWTCEYCAEINRRIWRAKIINHINNVGGDWSWFTLTAHSRARTPATSLANMRGAWDTLMKRIRRKYGAEQKVHYARVYERHANGAYHAHAIASFHFGDIKQRKQNDGQAVNYSEWLQKQAVDLSLGYYTHADDIEASHHAGYISSYVTKYIVKLDTLAKSELGRVRHIQTSQGWSPFENETLLDWKMKSGIYERDFTESVKREKPLIDIQTGEQITSDDFLYTYVYPPEFDHRTKPGYHPPLVVID